MVKALFDTNIVVDYLNGIEAAAHELQQYGTKGISIVTWIEVLIGARSEVAQGTRDFLDTFEIIAIDQAVAERAVAIRRRHRIKLPDAIIWASAECHSMLLVTRNTKDFPPDLPGVRMPYSVSH